VNRIFKNKLIFATSLGVVVVVVVVVIVVVVSVDYQSNCSYPSANPTHG
jgi:hypothetical protein